VKLVLLLAALSGLGLAASGSVSLREEQWKFPHVRMAAREKDNSLKQLFAQRGLSYPPRELLLRACKKETTLELWAEDTPSHEYVLVKKYSICAASGRLGPKRRFGDEQGSRGIYELDGFNPQSNFYLSLHVRYPSESDRILGSRTNPGGDIFLHGNCVTIGCLPITDDGIKEVYWLAVLAKTSGQRHLPIQIFPARLTDRELEQLASEQRLEPQVVKFWANLKEGFDYFESHHRPASVRIDRSGKYVIGGK